MQIRIQNKTDSNFFNLIFMVNAVPVLNILNFFRVRSEVEDFDAVDATPRGRRILLDRRLRE